MAKRFQVRPGEAAEIVEDGFDLVPDLNYERGLLCQENRCIIGLFVEFRRSLDAGRLWSGSSTELE
jgi:hypothetical protein